LNPYSVISTPFRWLKRHIFKLTVIVLATVAVYLIYIDGQVKQHFSGNKWEVPAQIYARPLKLELKQEISVLEVKDELSLLGYRQVADASETGEFSQGKDTITIFRRSFQYADINAPERVLKRITTFINIMALPHYLLFAHCLPISVPGALCKVAAH